MKVINKIKSLAAHEYRGAIKLLSIKEIKDFEDYEIFILYDSFEKYYSIDIRDLSTCIKGTTYNISIMYRKFYAVTNNILLNFLNIQMAITTYLNSTPRGCNFDYKEKLLIVLHTEIKNIIDSYIKIK